VVAGQPVRLLVVQEPIGEPEQPKSAISNVFNERKIFKVIAYLSVEITFYIDYEIS